MGESNPAGRRNFLAISAVAFAGVGGTIALWPLVAQMNPDPRTQRRVTTIELDKIAPGQLQEVKIDGMPVLVRHRTRDEIEAARGADQNAFRDPFVRVLGENPQLKADDRARTKPGHEAWLVVVGVCTYCSCIIRDAGTAGVGDTFVCPCCNSRYDGAGRAVRGPAPQNLKVPAYRFVSPLKIEISAVQEPT